MAPDQTAPIIPLHDPIIMGAVGYMVGLALGIVFLLTWYRKWGVLWRDWLTSVDHKRIGIMYIILALVMLLRGFSDAVLMRLQQAVALEPAHGFLSPGHFEQIFTAHGTIMILFMAMPFMAGLMNIVVPQQIGARDVAFPFMNALSLWLTVAAAMLVMTSLAVGEFSHDGWTGYAPLTELQYSPGVGVDYWMWAIQIAGIGSLMTGINFFVTIVRMRAPGMTLMRMPIFTWTTLCTNVLMVFSFPVLTVALALLALDRYLGMHFFSSTAGGNSMLYLDLFWIWGHPEVYIVILPAFGVFSEVVATFSGKRLFGYASLVYATIAITVLSFAVWLHHFFTMGAGGDVNAAFGIATMLIAVPTGVKMFNWLFTLYRGRVRFTTPLYWTLGFLTTFATGGMAGVLLGVPPADFVLHNSLFLVAHFHNMLIAGTLFGFFAGYAYWFPKATGFALDETWGRRAFWFWLSGFYLAFAPLYVLGFMGMSRRLDHYANPAWQPWLLAAAAGAALVLCGIVCQIIQLGVSYREREALRDHTGDWWGGRTLEWATASPAAVYNFAAIPEVGGIDAFHEMKARGAAQATPVHPGDIAMPRNTGTACVVGGCAYVLGIGLVWHLWTLAVLGTLAIVATVIARAMEDEVEYVIPAAEVMRIERARQVEADVATNAAGAGRAA